MIAALPDPGQLVDVRQRRFVVTEISRSALPHDPLSPHTNGQQHLVTLSSVEDDGLGEELRVVWELEPGARALERAALPEPAGFDEPRHLDAFLDAVRWGAISSANVRALQSPFRSGIDIEDYQLDPVVRALGMPRVNLLVAASLRPAKRREAMSEVLLSEFHVQALAYEELREGAFTEEGEAEVRKGFAELRAKADELLDNRRPFHWPLEFPEVFAEAEEPVEPDSSLDAHDLIAELTKPQEAFVSGFAAIVGNPPFQGGQKITGSLGTDYRDYLVEHVAGGKRGSADLSAYFLPRARDVIRESGGMGLLATNTIAQGDTREVGLDQLTGDSCVITRAVPSRKWPGAANLEVAHLWLRREDWAGSYVLDEQPVAGITSFLAEPGAAQGDPYRLAANVDKCFQGLIVLGRGFMLQPEETRVLIEKDPRNRDVLFPYLTGEDLNSRPDQSPSRWVINFFDWPLEYAESYTDSMQIVREEVKPERDRNTYSRMAREKWWRYERARPELYDAVAGMERVLLVAATSRTLAFAFSTPNPVFANTLYIHALESSGSFVLLQSAVYEVWARRYASSMKGDLRYSASDCFETFPFPSELSNLSDIGERYYSHRQGIMQARQEGLPKTYNRFHDPDESAENIERLRELHVEMDRAVADAYGWGDLDLGHGFHETKQGVRSTISEEARREVLDRLLLLNHERYEEEVKQGLHDKKAKKGKKGKGKKRARKSDGGTPLAGFGDGA